MMVENKPPFPWFGGKSRVADLVWQRFGDVPNYVEPFFGSGAVLFLRPHEPRVETVNDLDCMVANFWRALQSSPDEVASHADWPVNECDLNARHRWLIEQKSTLQKRLFADPDYYDAKIAGWWVWGISQWIGGRWCKERSNNRPHLGNAGMGVHRRRPHLGRNMGVHRRSPHLGRKMGVHRPDTRVGLYDYMAQLSARLRKVRVCCGQWHRVLGPSPTHKLGLTAVFLDPPYSAEERDPAIYNEDSMTVAADVRKWALEHGDNPQLRMALCGYEGEHEMPADWECVVWKAGGGYSNRGTGSRNRFRERIWFSPHCLVPQLTLF